MSNPYPTFTNIASKLSGVFQVISDNKWATRTLAIGVASAQTDFFTAAPSGDTTVDNYDAANQLVTSGKKFVIQGLTVNPISTSIADVNAVIEQGVIVLTIQNKEVGRFRVRNLAAAGGTFVAGAQVAAASSVGVTNGNPQTDVWRIGDILVDTNQTVKATLYMPQGALAYTIIAATTVEVGLIGYTVQPAA